jgi:predicted DsbA family dithiol-disulfide isomerase
VNNPGDYSKEKLKTFAEELNLDTKAFNECLDSGKYTELVQSQTNIARQIGVQSAPTFIVNGKAIIGAQPFKAFQQAIDSLLNR